VFSDKDIRINKSELFVKAKSEVAGSLRLSLAPREELQPSLQDGLLHAEKSFNTGQRPGSWTLAAWLGEGEAHRRFDADAVEDIYVICHYVLG
jgi:hypothetical protein